MQQEEPVTSIEAIDAVLRKLGNYQRQTMLEAKGDLLNRVGSVKFAKLYNQLLNSDPTNTKELDLLAEEIWKSLWGVN